MTTYNKASEESKAGELNVSKGWFNNFRKGFVCKNVKITGEAASADEEAVKFPDAFKIIAKKAICLNCYLIQMKVFYSGKKKKKSHTNK